MEELHLEDLYEMQKDLDESVAERTGVDLNGYESVENRNYGFHTEVHELANEIGFFKYWKQSHVMDRDKTLEELVDCIHFLLSLGITKSYTKVVRSVEVFPLWEDYDMYSMFYEIRRNELDSVGKYQLAFSLILGIAAKCGFTMQDVRKGYILKNAVNEVRQLNQY